MSCFLHRNQWVIDAMEHHVVMMTTLPAPCFMASQSQGRVLPRLKYAVSRSESSPRSVCAAATKIQAFRPSLCSRSRIAQAAPLLCPTRTVPAGLSIKDVTNGNQNVTRPFRGSGKSRSTHSIPRRDSISLANQEYQLHSATGL